MKIAIRTLMLIGIYLLTSFNNLAGVLLFLVVAQFNSHIEYVSRFDPNDIMNTSPLIRDWFKGKGLIRMLFLWQLFLISSREDNAWGKMALFYLGTNQFTSIALFAGLIDNLDMPMFIIWVLIFGGAYFIITNIIVGVASRASREK